MNDGYSSIDNDGRGLIGIVLIALAAVLYFGMPPSYGSVGPLHLGEKSGTCHGASVDGKLIVEVCK